MEGEDRVAARLSGWLVTVRGRLIIDRFCVHIPTTFQNEQRFHGAPENCPARRPVASEVAPELSERHRGFLVGRRRGHSAACHSAQNGKLSVSQRPARAARLSSCRASQSKQSDGDRQKDAESGLDRAVTLELPVLEPASALERLEKLLDDPACSVGVDDELDLGAGLNRLGSDQKTM